jgi:thiamine kinase-like enzyme
MHGDRVNHSSLVPENLLWSDTELVGAIDWDDTRPGDINQELRGALEMGPEVLEGAIEELEERDIQTDRKHIISWSLIRTIGILSYWISKASTNNSHFHGAAARIQRLMPDEDWLELY